MSFAFLPEPGLVRRKNASQFPVVATRGEFLTLHAYPDITALFFDFKSAMVTMFCEITSNYFSACLQSILVGDGMDV